MAMNSYPLNPAPFSPAGILLVMVHASVALAIGVCFIQRLHPWTRFVLAAVFCFVASFSMMQGLASWIDIVRKHHSQSYQHCLLVTGVAVAFGQQLGLSLADRQRLSFAGMLHDIGKCKLPPESARFSSTRLPPADNPKLREEWETHPHVGYDMVRRGIEPSASVAIPVGAKMPCRS